MADDYGDFEGDDDGVDVAGQYTEAPDLDGPISQEDIHPNAYEDPVHQQHQQHLQHQQQLVLQHQQQQQLQHQQQQSPFGQDVVQPPLYGEDDGGPPILDPPLALLDGDGDGESSTAAHLAAHGESFNLMHVGCGVHGGQHGHESYLSTEVPMHASYLDRHVTVAQEASAYSFLPLDDRPGSYTQPNIRQNKKGWEQSTTDKLEHARNLAKKAAQSIVDNESAHQEAQKFHGHSNVVNHTFRKKISRSQDLCKSLEDRIESIEDTIRQAGECLFQMQRAHRCKWGPLNVCERRLELRAARPPQELVRDHCQEALEAERKMLNEARAGLAYQIAKMRDVLIGLDRVKGELAEDLRHKRHALRIDRSCLSPRKPAAGGAMAVARDRLVLPSLQDVPFYSTPPSPKGAEHGSGPVHEEHRRESTEKLVARAIKVEEDAIRFANECDSVIHQTRRECEKATAHAQAELSRRVDELQKMKRQLEAHMQSTDEAIAATELSMAKTKKTLESHDTPLRALDKQFHWRGARTAPEGIRDHVQDELEGHLDSLKKSVKGLTDKLQASKDILDQLRASKQQMQEDYRAKIQAQKIDDACIKVTPRKSMEMDRKDPRGGRCAKTPRTKRMGHMDQSLQNSYPMNGGIIDQIY